MTIRVYIYVYVYGMWYMGAPRNWGSFKKGSRALLSRALGFI